MDDEDAEDMEAMFDIAEEDDEEGEMDEGDSPTDRPSIPWPCPSPCPSQATDTSTYPDPD